jgi:predicted ArsR family transcriptional regulator
MCHLAATIHGHRPSNKIPLTHLPHFSITRLLELQIRHRQEVGTMPFFQSTEKSIKRHIYKNQDLIKKVSDELGKVKNHRASIYGDQLQHVISKQIEEIEDLYTKQSE